MNKKAPPLQTFAEIANRIKPLAMFYVEHKPEQRSIAVFPADYAHLHSWPQYANHYGFERDGDRVLFKGFLLVPMGRDE